LAIAGLLSGLTHRHTVHEQQFSKRGIFGCWFIICVRLRPTYNPQNLDLSPRIQASLPRLSIYKPILLPTNSLHNQRQRVTAWASKFFINMPAAVYLLTAQKTISSFRRPSVAIQRGKGSTAFDMIRCRRQYTCISNSIHNQYMFSTLIEPASELQFTPSAALC